MHDAAHVPEDRPARSAPPELRQERLLVLEHQDRQVVLELADPQAPRGPARPGLLARRRTSSRPAATPRPTGRTAPSGRRRVPLVDPRSLLADSAAVGIAMRADCRSWTHAELHRRAVGRIRGPPRRGRRDRAPSQWSRADAVRRLGRPGPGQPRDRRGPLDRSAARRARPSPRSATGSTATCSVTIRSARSRRPAPRRPRRPRTSTRRTIGAPVVRRRAGVANTCTSSRPTT